MQTNVEFSADMHCRSCEQRVQRALGALDGVRSVDTDLKHQRVEVEFDDELVDDSQLRRAAAGAVTHGAFGG